jgi:hypothetical protein
MGFGAVFLTLLATRAKLHFKRSHRADMNNT